MASIDPAIDPAIDPTIGPATQNKLLAAIPDNERERVFRQLTPVFMVFGETLHERDAQSNHVYFPTTAIVSLSQSMPDDTSVEMTVIGNEGVVGVALFLSGALTPSRAVVNGSGWAYGLTGPLLKQEFIRCGAMQQLLLRYTQALIAQIAQTVDCKLHHPIDQQLCRWLLLRLDRIGTAEATMTQQLVADMTGITQATLSVELGKLRSGGLISYIQGQIAIVNRAGLEARACQCYRALKRESDWRVTPMRASAQTGSTYSG